MNQTVIRQAVCGCTIRGLRSAGGNQRLVAANLAAFESSPNGGMASFGKSVL